MVLVEGIDQRRKMKRRRKRNVEARRDASRYYERRGWGALICTGKIAHGPAGTVSWSWAEAVVLSVHNLIAYLFGSGYQLHCPEDSFVLLDV